MPISKSDLLFALISSLSRGEKRHFKSYAKRESEGSNLKYLQLFDILDKQKVLDESDLSSHFDKRQLPNLKRHLYSQIMVSLKLQQSQSSVAIQLRELLDYANILYSRGLYLQSLKIIAKAKVLATKINEELSLLQLLEFEKIIESRHITRTGTDRVDQLTKETNELMVGITNRLVLSNLRLELHGGYVKYGHVSSDTAANEVRELFAERLLEVDESTMGLLELAYYYQSRVWYHFILLEMDDVLDYARRWLELFKMDGKYIHRDTNLIMRAYHYILTSLYHIGDIGLYDKYLQEFEQFRNQQYKKFNTNSQIISFIYVHNGRLNRYILAEDYAAGLAIIPKTLTRIKRYKAKLDSHRILVLYYKMSLLYIMAGEPGKAIKYLHSVMNAKLDNLRSDIQGYARMAFLMAHFDLENYDVVQSHIRSVRTYIDKEQISTEVSDMLLRFFAAVTKVPIQEQSGLFKVLSSELRQLSKNIYTKRGLLYLHVQEWVKGRVRG